MRLLASQTSAWTYACNDTVAVCVIFVHHIGAHEREDGYNVLQNLIRQMLS